MGSTPFFIPDTSPLFAYDPCVDCASSSSWVAAYSSAVDGFDQTFHQTNVSESSVAFNISASSLSISGQSTGSDCNAVYSINGSSFASACSNANDTALSSLPGGLHQVKVQPKQDVTTFQFMGVSGTIPLTSSARYENLTVDDISSFTYSPGDWTYFNAAGLNGTAADESIASDYSDMSSFFGESVSVSTAMGASANLTFQAEAIFVFGMSGPEGGSAEVMLDGVMTQILNLTVHHETMEWALRLTGNSQATWKTYSSLLYQGAGFNVSDTHSLSIVHTTPGRQLVIDYALLTVPVTTSSYVSSHLALVIGLISGISAAFLVLGILIYLTRIRRLRRSGRNPYLFSTGAGYNQTTGRTDEWRKDMTGESPTTPFTGKSHLSPEDSMSYRLPPSDDPDYLPYRGPVEREPAAGRYDEPLPIVGANPTAQRWLEDQAALIESHGPARQNPVYTGRNIPRPPPLPFRLRLDRFDNIALDDYYRDESEADPDGFSPIGSTPSTLGLTGRTARAVGATRSVARLWPSRDAIPSTLRQQSADPPADSILFTPSHTTAGTFSICQSQMHGSGLASRSIFTNPTHSNPSSSHPSSFHSALRRGVSVKSVKTMRSFFSTLLFHSSSTSLAVQTPALPLAAARPDSDIFPIGSLSRSNSAADDGIESSTNARMAQRDGGRETSPNLVIELNPNSPMTMAPSSRPDSDWTQWRSGFTGGV